MENANVIMGEDAVQVGGEPSQVWPPKSEPPTLNTGAQLLDINAGAMPVRDPADPAQFVGPLIGQAADVRQTSFDIRECPACGGSHEAVKLIEYQRPVGVFTHWFECPTSHDPASLTLLALKSQPDDALELNGSLCQFLATAQMAGRYIVAVGWIDDGNKIQVAKTTWRFPTGDYFPSGPQNQGFMGELKKLLEQEIGAQQPAEMKPATPHPLKRLLGMANAENVQQIKLPGRPVGITAEDIQSGRIVAANAKQQEAGMRGESYEGHTIHPMPPQ